MNDRLFISAMGLVPKNALSRLAGALTRWRAPAPVRLAAMKAFARRYGIDLSESPDLEVYGTFGEFFARPLRPGLRPIAPGDDVVVSPVDAVVSETGHAAGGRRPAGS
jgi:phosphatidylserine decarboxylase